MVYYRANFLASRANRAALRALFLSWLIVIAAFYVWLSYDNFQYRLPWSNEAYIARHAARAPQTRQKEAIAIIEKHRSLWEKAEEYKNEFGTTQARTDRAKALCSILGDRRFDRWVGIVTEVSTSGTKEGMVTLQFGRDMFIRGQIDLEAGKLGDIWTYYSGDPVTITGSFFPDESDCFSEASFTAGGGMKEPEFRARVTSLSRHK